MKINFKKFCLRIGFIATLANLPAAYAADFNLPFVNGADLGDAYAGWAASASDASTAFTNPAGLVKLNHQQLVVSGIGLMGSTQFTGSTSIPALPGLAPQVGTASSKVRGLIPTLYYAAPAYKNMVFALSATAPFALGTNYSPDSIVRYSATRTQLAVMDLSPSVGIKLNEKFSLGLGFDAARLALTLNNMYGPPFSIPDSEGQNHLAGWGYGWHGGVLYQPLASTRIGLSFNSMLVIHSSGDSEVFASTGETRTTNQRSNVALPANTHLSLSQEITPRFTLLATVVYTNWRTLNQLTLKNTMTPLGILSITVPFQYHNTFDYAAGLNFKATDKWLLRTGLMLCNAPSNNRDRSVADPVGGWALLGLGAQYMQNAKLSYDVSYAHGFFQTMHINATTALSSLAGHSSQNVNIFAAQLTWNIT